ncbi:uncharacterized protein [Drosophila virilis]|uniref:DUF4794 domain-containing protein n=1 Tax=Drosophila virilis TaxID=7244 RepID=B4LHL2_DROVI|nr:uncharacterized protein LOC6622947 [Drosophila virilis]EDW69565.2 uncharacterized protein Dvir_GJ13321 [Drosophila virilis]
MQQIEQFAKTFLSVQSSFRQRMRKFLIFVALCAVCTAAPAPADITETGNATVRAIPPILKELLEPAAKSIGTELVPAESTKPKRESPAKPAHDEPAVPEFLIPLIEPADNKSARHQRDIPVPTQAKTTTAAPNEEQEKPQQEDVNAHVPEEDSNTSLRPLLHHPVPISEVLNKPKTTAEPSSSSSSSSSSEESEKIKT